jgi:hypothetical protein
MSKRKAGNPNMVAGNTVAAGNNIRLDHGLRRAKRVVDEYGKRAIDGRSEVAQRLKRWRTAIIADLGGLQNVSAQQLSIVELLCRTKMLLDSIDAFVLTMPSPINKRSRSLQRREGAPIASELLCAAVDCTWTRTPAGADEPFGAEGSTTTYRTSFFVATPRSGHEDCRYPHSSTPKFKNFFRKELPHGRHDTATKDLG